MNFRGALRYAYAHDYDMPHMVQFGKKPIIWCKKLSFLDSTSERRITLACGDVVIYREKQIGLLKHIFVHETNLGAEHRRLFAVITPIDDTHLLDPILQLPRLRLRASAIEDELIIVGLPVIKAEKLYVIPVRTINDTTLAIAKLEIADELLWVNWTLHYL